jgi:DNA polymerase (family 10)
VQVRNSDIAAAFYRLAVTLEIGGANPFRVQASRNAARTLEGLPESAAKMIKAGKDLAELPAIGRDLAGKITEMGQDRASRRSRGGRKRVAGLPGRTF